jgi:S-adenosylmethionine:tRNA ribosyltransferase-isomerase
VNAAVWPRPEPELERLLVDDGERLVDATVGELPGFLAPGDLLVVNDAATLPASLAGTSDGAVLEARLFELDAERASARAILFGAGSWRTPTERRPAPPPLALGAEIRFGAELRARVARLLDGRVVELAFSERGATLLSAIYAHGRPVQYAYVAGRFELWHVQSRFAGRPWAFELPSAGRPLTFATLAELRRRGVRIAALTHAAGLSSTGSDALDRALPGPERYAIPARTAELVGATRAEGGRVIAVGTTVTRALEASAARRGQVGPGEGVARLSIGNAHRLRAVDALLTGVHAPGTSHFELLAAFAPRERLESAHAHAVRAGYLGHELGDSLLIFSDRARLAAA